MGGLCNVASKSQKTDALDAVPSKLRVLDQQMPKGGGFDDGISAPPPADRAAGPAGGQQLASYNAGAARIVEGQVMPAEEPGHRPPGAKAAPTWEEPENIRRLRAELVERDKATEDLRRESARLAGLMEILERETFDKELALREAQDIREVLLQREEEMSRMKQRAEANEEVLRAVIAEASAKGDAVESLVCSLTQQAHQAQLQRPSALNAATPITVKVEGKTDIGAQQRAPTVQPRGPPQEAGAEKSNETVGADRDGEAAARSSVDPLAEVQTQNAAARSCADFVSLPQEANVEKGTEAAGSDSQGSPQKPIDQERELEQTRVAAAASLVSAALDGSLGASLLSEAAVQKAPEGTVPTCG